MENLEMVQGASLLKLLIVEDDVTLRPIWEFLLERWGENFEVTWVVDVPTAEKRMSEADRTGNPYAIVVSDIFLSGSLTGLDLWRNRRGTGPLFLLTSVISQEKFHQWVVGDDERPQYLQKPFDVEKVLCSLRTLSHLSRRTS